MAVAIWDPLSCTRCCSLPFTRKSRGSSSRSGSSCVAKLKQNGGNKGRLAAAQAVRNARKSGAMVEAIHLEPCGHITARGTKPSVSGLLLVGGLRLTGGLHANGEGRLGQRASTRQGGRCLSNRGSNSSLPLTRITSVASDSASPTTSATASDNVDASTAPPASSTTSLSTDIESDVAGVTSTASEREPEAFVIVNTGDYECRSCGYEYIEVNGDQSYPIPPGMPFSNLPSDWACPVCGAPRSYFSPKRVEIAGFAQNQKYGLGGNSLTSSQKSLLIYGSLLLFFAAFLSGYLLQ